MPTCGECRNRMKQTGYCIITGAVNISPDQDAESCKWFDKPTKLEAIKEERGSRPTIAVNCPLIDSRGYCKALKRTLEGYEILNCQKYWSRCPDYKRNR